MWAPPVCGEVGEVKQSQQECVGNPYKLAQTSTTDWHIMHLPLGHTALLLLQIVGDTLHAISHRHDSTWHCLFYKLVEMVGQVGNAQAEYYGLELGQTTLQTDRRINRDRYLYGDMFAFSAIHWNTFLTLNNLISCAGRIYPWAHK